jgi:hypothetical protein
MQRDKKEIIIVLVISIFCAAWLVYLFHEADREAAKRKEFATKCAAHNGLVYKTKDGDMCMKRDSVIIL